MDYYHFHIFFRGKKGKSARPTLYSGFVQADKKALDKIDFYQDLIASAFKGKVSSSTVLLTSSIVNFDGRYPFARKFSFKIKDSYKYNRTGAFLLTEVNFKQREYYIGHDKTGHGEYESYKFSSLYSHVNYLEEEEE